MNLEKLKEVLAIQTYSKQQWRMFAYIVRKVKEIPNCVLYTNEGNIYITKGKATNYPCVIAHMDSVHKIEKDLTVVELPNGTLTGFNCIEMEQTGIGGDDKVGIFIALESLKHFDNIKVAFFRDEEIGCVGSYEADLTFFEDCNYVLQCDRQGNKDFITDACGVILSGVDFQKDLGAILYDHNYDFHYGGMTDVMALKELGVKCAMANMSCGYYNPHSYSEYVSIKDVKNCLDMVFKIISSLTKSYIYEYKEKTIKKYNTHYTPKHKSFNRVDWWYGDNEEELDDNSDFHDAIDECECCAEYNKLYFVSDYNMDMCEKCIDSYVDYDRQTKTKQIWL